jgi:hypothetical protein
MFKGLGVLPGADSSMAAGISANGSTVIGWSFYRPAIEQYAVPWKEGEIVDLGNDGFTGTLAYAVSADGSTAVGCGYRTSCFGAFIWDARKGLRDLIGVLMADGNDQVTDWLTGQATGISADGGTIGRWGDPSVEGMYAEAWIPRHPEPGTDALRLTGGVLEITRGLERPDTARPGEGGTIGLAGLRALWRCPIPVAIGV